MFLKKLKNMMTNSQEEKIIEKFGIISKKIGLGKNSGKIYGFLLFSDKDLTKEEIIRKLGNNQIQEDLGLLVRTGLIKNISNKYSFNQQLEDIIEFGKDVFEKDINSVILDLKKIKTDSPTKRKRLNKIVKNYKRISKFYNLGKKLLGLKNKFI